ncbi:hypothetical protein [Vibrio sp. HN007]|uniref:hypothetical protein n=1 Tax=Vibrio iocasae TaxID=3098914 RepID=UPI0035D437B5
MNTHDKHSMWELEVEGFDRPVLASHLVDYMNGGTDDTLISQSRLKSYIAEASAHSKNYAVCLNCGCPVVFVAGNPVSGITPYFRHNVAKAPDPERTELCSFYSGATSFFGTGDIYFGEGKWHFENKHWLAEQILRSGHYKNLAIEKYLFSKDAESNRRRKPDIYFEDLPGNRYAIELTRFWMSPEVIALREAFFREQSINLIWLFSPDCEARNNTTLNVVLYGSATSREEAKPDVLEKVECNAFLLTQEARYQTEQNSELTFEVLYPVARYQNDTKSITIANESVIKSITDFSLLPDQRLPYAVITSASFTEALSQKEQAERDDIAKHIRLLRQLAYSDDQILNDYAHNEIKEQLSWITVFLSKRRFHKRIDAYIDLINRKLSNSLVELNRKQKRKYLAKALLDFRKHFNTAFYLAKNSSNLDRLRQESLRLDELKDSVFYYESSILNKRLNSAIVKVSEKVLQLHKLKEESARKAQSSQNTQFKELEEFIAQLERGFDDLVPDRGLLEVKATRLSKWASRNGVKPSADMSYLVNQAVYEAEVHYYESHYPNLYRGYQYNGLYREELEAAFELLRDNPYRKKDRQYSQHKAYQEATRRLLHRFHNQFNQHVEVLFDDLLLCEPATLASFAKSHKTNVHRLHQLQKFLASNGFNTNLAIRERLMHLEQSILGIFSGLNLNTLYYQLKALVLDET